MRNSTILSGSLLLCLLNTSAIAQTWTSGGNSIYYNNPSTPINVGININTPWSALDVRTNGSAETGYYGINVQNPSSVNYCTINLNLGTYNSSSLIQSQRNGGGLGTTLSLHTSDASGVTTPRLAIDQDGQVSIGTNTPAAGYKLSVNGQAIFNKVVVKPYPWSDYVFDSTYRLKPIEEVHQYIQANHHLPEIPSAADVEKNGVDVGVNQAALLKKIEELTLYVIQLNETVKKQQEKIDRLERTNKR